MPSTAHRTAVPRGPKGRQSVGSAVLASRRYSLQSECRENSQQRPLHLWLELIAPYTLGWGRSQGTRLVSGWPQRVLHSNSTGPGDSFFHSSEHSDKYSNLKGGSSSSWRRQRWWWWQEWWGRDGRSRLRKSRSRGELLSARTLHLSTHLTCRPICICIFSQSKYPDHQHFTVLQTVFYSSREKKQEDWTLTDA